MRCTHRGKGKTLDISSQTSIKSIAESKFITHFMATSANINGVDADASLTPKYIKQTYLTRTLVCAEPRSDTFLGETEVATRGGCELLAFWNGTNGSMPSTGFDERSRILLLRKRNQGLREQHTEILPCACLVDVSASSSCLSPLASVALTSLQFLNMSTTNGACVAVHGENYYEKVQKTTGNPLVA